MNSIPNLKISNPDSPERADLGEASTDCLHQEPTVEKRVQSIAYPFFDDLQPFMYTLPSPLFPLFDPTKSARISPLFEGEIESKKGDPRLALNSILSFLINNLPGHPFNIAGHPAFYTGDAAATHDRFFSWRNNGALEKVLTLLSEEAQGSLQTYYRELLENLQKASDPTPKPISIEMIKLSQPPELPFEGVTSREWTFVQPLLNEGGKSEREDLRFALNLILATSMGSKSESFPQLVPRHPNSCGWEVVTHEHFSSWRDNGTLWKLLLFLSERSRGLFQGYYRKLFDSFGAAKDSYGMPPEPASMEMIKLSKPAESLFQGLTDKEWSLVEPLLSKERGNR